MNRITRYTVRLSIGLFATISAFVFLLAFVAAAQAEKRIALVIGNSSYKSIAPLDNPKNDAELIADTLAALDFNVIRLFDADQRSMKSAVQQFGRELKHAGQDTVGLFYYAGHGVEVLGENYLIPLRTAIEVESDLELDGVSTNWVLAKMRAAGNALNIVVLDACRNNPFRTFRSASQGLGVLDAPRGSVIAYAAAPKQRAYDGTGAHSPYSQSLAKWMKEPNISVEGVFKNVLIDVEKQTNNRQTPWVSSSFKGNFFFAPAEVAAEADPVKTTAPQSAPQSASDREALFWSSIQDSGDWRSYQAYLDRYGEDGEFSVLASLRLERFKGELEGEAKPSDPSAAAAMSENESLFWSSIQGSEDWRAYQAYLDRYGEGAEFGALARLRVERLKNKAEDEAKPTELASLTTANKPVADENGDERSIVIEPSDRTMYARRGSNLRAGPGTTHDIVGHLIAGEEVRVTGQVGKGSGQGGWYRLTSKDGEKGFVWAPLLGDQKPEEPKIAVAKLEPAPLSQSDVQISPAPEKVAEPTAQPLEPEALSQTSEAVVEPISIPKTTTEDTDNASQIAAIPSPEEAEPVLSYNGRWRLRLFSKNLFPGGKDVDVRIRDGSFYAPVFTTRWRGYLSGKVSPSGHLTAIGKFNRTGGWYGGGEPMNFEWQAELLPEVTTTKDVPAEFDEGVDYLTISMERE